MSPRRRQIGTPGGSPERPALFFGGPQEFRAWLEANHQTAPELWMGLYKKHVPERGLVWADAVVEALCYGWIDSVAQRIDDDAVRQRWTPRRPTSVWSKVNLESVARLTEEGRMQPSGLAAFERRKEDRQAIYAYEQAEQGVLPTAYQALLDDSPAATAFFAASTASYRKLCLHWVLSAKQEATRDRRMTQLVESCRTGQLIPSQRYGETPTWIVRATAAAQEAGGS